MKMGKFEIAATQFSNKKREKNNGNNKKNQTGSAILTKLQATNFFKRALLCEYVTSKFTEF